MLKKLINKSYSLSGDDSVKLLLMTATPFTDSPMELFKLMNLMKEDERDYIPEDIDVFKTKYLNQENEFTERGLQRLANELTGYISYLDRSKDISQFANPIKVRVTSFFTAFTKEERHALYCEMPDADEFSSETSKEIAEQIKEHNGRLKTVKKQITEHKKNKTQKQKECRSSHRGKDKKEEKERCIKEAEDTFQRDTHQLLREQLNLQEQIDKLRKEKSSFQTKKNKYKDTKRNVREQRKTLKKRDNQESAFTKKFLNYDKDGLTRKIQSKMENVSCIAEEDKYYSGHANL